MCLDTKDKHFSRAGGIGYKAMRLAPTPGGKSVYGPTFTRPRSRVGEWTKDTADYPIVMWSWREYGDPGKRSGTYRTGFHIFKTKSAANLYAKRRGPSYVVVTVQYKHVTATGRQNRKKVIVARHMKPLKVEVAR